MIFYFRVTLTRVRKLPSLPYMKLAALVVIALVGLVAFSQEAKPIKDQSLAELRASAEKGDAPSQSMLGIMYDYGGTVGQDRVPQDSAEAVKWYRKAAEQGYASAQFQLAMAYSLGKGVPEDPVQAVSWTRKAAEQGEAFAQNSLGRMYAEGDGVPKDSAEAAKWYRKAAEQGNMFAQSYLGDVYLKGDGVAKNSTEAAKWFRKAAEQGWAPAQHSLGMMIASGNGVPKNSAEAAMWYRKAAERGNTFAQFNLGFMYAYGEGVATNAAEAVKWYRKAADQGNDRAQHNLGIMYANGEGVAKDEIEALAWFNIAAASGSDRAVKSRENSERRLGREMTLIAQQRSKEILKEIEVAKRATTPPFAGVPSTGEATPGEESPKASGTGTIVSRDGYVLTAAHVVVGARRVTAYTIRGLKAAKVVRVDEANDLAILKLANGDYSPLPVAPSRKVRLGQAVATIGFPNILIQGFSPKVTRGEINSANGAGDDPRSWQISVPVQPGSSGGPLLDESGNLIGVVVGKLGLEAAAATGDLPQNVNYAVKSAYALPLLEPVLGANAPAPSGQKRALEDMVAKAQQSVVLVLAY